MKTINFILRLSGGILACFSVWILIGLFAGAVWLFERWESLQ